MYQVYAQIQGAHVLSVPLKENGQLDVDGILATATDKTKLIFIPTPNAPMGHAMDKADMLALCKARVGKSVIVADEAYVEFSGEPDGFAPELNKVSNLVLLRTLSKAHALAGERVGCVMAPRNLVAFLRCVVPPYPLAQSAVRAALDALSPAGLAQSAGRKKTIKAERTYLIAQLAKSADVVRIYPSVGNFLFVETTDAKAFLAKLQRFGILPRSMDGQRKNAVRIAVGSPEENDFLLGALDIATERKRVSLRTGTVQRKTKETAIDVLIDLEVGAEKRIQTGLGFFDHMLDQIATHGGFGLTLQATGDLSVDPHHTIEDCALALGEALRKALGDKKGLARFGFTAPLDEAVAQIVLDLSGRPFADVKIESPRVIGDGMEPDLAVHFFRSFADGLRATLHLTASGDNNHHVIEASFKALGRALRQATARVDDVLPSTKGSL